MPAGDALPALLDLFDGTGPIETPTPGVQAWLARDAQGAQRPVLIKRVDGTGAGKGRATEALALLHPAIVRTRRWLFDETGLYVVRDVIRGKNLRQSLAADSMRQSAEATRQILMPVIEALAYAHGQGFAHGGISPENILIGEDGRVSVSDWATADPKAPQHFRHYQGTASVAGDVRALGRLIAEFLPTVGSFAHTAVRERIEGILQRCDTLADLQETVSALDRLAAAPLPREAVAAPPRVSPGPTLPPLDVDENDEPTVEDWMQSGQSSSVGTPRLACLLGEKSARVAQGGGGIATLIVRNDGDADLVLRMIATQHAWLNVRPLDLPLVVAPGKEESLEFAISAARLTPGEYRSEVYLSANASGKSAEDLRGGWFKHTAEMRITVMGEGTLPPLGEATSPAKPPYPAHAARVPGGTGCLLALPMLFLSLWRASVGHVS